MLTTFFLHAQTVAGTKKIVGELERKVAMADEKRTQIEVGHVSNRCVVAHR